MRHPIHKTTHPRARRRNEDGMTLLEVMVAMAVLVTGLVMAMGSLTGTWRVGAINEDRAMAASAMASIADEVCAIPLDDLLEYEPPSPLPGTIRGVTVEIIDVDEESYALPVDPSVQMGALPNPLEVQVTVLWFDRDGRQFSKQLTAYHTR